MTNALAEAERGIGDNNPPSDIDILRSTLAAENAALITRKLDLLASVSRAPETVDDDVTAGRVADLIKLMMACSKNAESTRTGRKEPFLEAGRAVDGFFKTITEPLATAKVGLERKLTIYQRQKEAEERRQLEEMARLAREEADRLAAEAARQAVGAATMAALEVAIDAEDRALNAQADANKAAVEAAAPAADLSRTRGDYGSVSSLRTDWVGELTDRAALDLEALRQHLPEEALEKAIRSFVKAGGRKLDGARIYEHTHSVVR